MAGGPADASLPPSLQGLPPRSVPEVDPTPLQKHYVLLMAPVLIAGAIAITALEIGVPLQPAREAVRADRRPAARRHDARRDAADLALGLGLDAGRPREGPLPAGLGRRHLAILAIGVAFALWVLTA